jgi:hypothetical protein
MDWVVPTLKDKILSIASQIKSAYPDIANYIEKHAIHLQYKLTDKEIWSITQISDYIEKHAIQLQSNMPIEQEPKAIMTHIIKKWDLLIDPIKHLETEKEISDWFSLLPCSLQINENCMSDAKENSHDNTENKHVFTITDWTITRVSNGPEYYYEGQGGIILGPFVTPHDTPDDQKTDL